MNDAPYTATAHRHGPQCWWDHQGPGWVCARVPAPRPPDRAPRPTAAATPAVAPARVTVAA